MRINDRKVDIWPGATVLEVAIKHGIDLPTLCFHPGIEKYGGCRVCIVEMKGSGRLEASCTLPASETLEVLTDSPQVKEVRQGLITLLFERVGPIPQLVEMARRHGLTFDALSTLGKDSCILCGRCVRVCSALGVRAINFQAKGKDRRITPPFNQGSPECLACLACSNVCPVGAVRVSKSDDDKEVILEKWKTKARLFCCPTCGKDFIPEKLLIHVAKKLPEIAHSHLQRCPACRQRLCVSRLAPGGLRA